MKKFLLAFCILAAAAVNANAQFFLGGSLSIDNRSRSNFLNDTKAASENKFVLTLAPQIGYQINEKNAAGLYVSLAPIFATSKTFSPDETEKKSYFGWSVSPFYRYTCCSFKKFDIIGEAYATIGMQDKDLNYGINIRPLLSYAVNEHFLLECGLNFLSLGWNGDTYTNETTYGKVKVSDGAFYFGFNNKSTISLGAVYKF